MRIRHDETNTKQNSNRPETSWDFRHKNLGCPAVPDYGGDNEIKVMFPPANPLVKLSTLKKDKSHQSWYVWYESIN